MKAITIHQPWASLIALGLKRFETRGWRTSYRGELAIHASKSKEYLHWFSQDRHIREAFASRGFESYLGAMPRGAILAIGSLAGCVRSDEFDGLVLHSPSHERAFGDWSAGRYGFEVAGVRRLKQPIPWAGQQQLWVVPPKLESLIRQAEFAS